MYISSDALKRTSNASGDVANVATRLLNLAERTPDPDARNALLGEAQRLLAIARGLIATIDEVTVANATPQSSALIGHLAVGRHGRSGGLGDIYQSGPGTGSPTAGSPIGQDPRR